MDKLLEHRAHIEQEGTLSERRRNNLRSEVLALATHRVRRDLEERLAQGDGFEKLIDDVVARRLDPASAAAAILDQDVL
jgi:LAO/AO transport system kinase